jgi:hypothetical protein
MSWAQCLDPPLASAPINPDCITNTTASYLVPFGSGLSLMTTMPDVPLANLGRPDSSGGLYVPLIAHASAGTDALVASYLLRRNLGAPPNHNPVLSGAFVVLGDADAGVTMPSDGGAGADLVPLDDAHPFVVHAGDEITLRLTFAPGSAERYVIQEPASGTSRAVTETLSATWYSTAGTFAETSTGTEVPDVVLHLDQVKNGPPLHLPPSAGPIDLWIVGNDERGGTDYLHRTLQLE